MVKLEVGQPVKVYERYGNLDIFDGKVVKVGRTLATIQWEYGGFSTKALFRMDDGYENRNDYRNHWFKTLEQAADDDRREEALAYLQEHGIEHNYYQAQRLPTSALEALAACLRAELEKEA